MLARGETKKKSVFRLKGTVVMGFRAHTTKALAEKMPIKGGKGGDFCPKRYVKILLTLMLKTVNANLC